MLDFALAQGLKRIDLTPEKFAEKMWVGNNKNVALVNDQNVAYILRLCVRECRNLVKISWEFSTLNRTCFKLVPKQQSNMWNQSLKMKLEGWEQSTKFAGKIILSTLLFLLSLSCLCDLKHVNRIYEASLKYLVFSGRGFCLATCCMMRTSCHSFQAFWAILIHINCMHFSSWKLYIIIL